jgi:hypothetical protein
LTILAGRRQRRPPSLSHSQHFKEFLMTTSSQAVTSIPLSKLSDLGYGNRQPDAMT